MSQRMYSVSPTDTGCSMESPAPDQHDPHSSEEELEVINNSKQARSDRPLRAASVCLPEKRKWSQVGDSYSRRYSPENEENMSHYGNLSPASPCSPYGGKYYGDDAVHLEHSGSSDDEVHHLFASMATPVQFRTSTPLEAVKPGGRTPNCKIRSSSLPPKLVHYEVSPRKRSRHTRHLHVQRPCLDFEKMQQVINRMNPDVNIIAHENRVGVKTESVYDDACEDLHHSIDIKEEDEKLDGEVLHHSIDIKEEDEKPFSCEICEYKCARKSTLNRHSKKHTGEKPFACEICDYQCAYKSNLKVHLSTHTGEKRFMCKICDYKTFQKITLQRHLKIHSGVKPFTCELCHRKFALETYLNLHLKTHTGEKAFACYTCDYKCIRKATLKRHLKSHTGEKSLSCKICDYKCAYRSSLKVHLGTHTGEKPYNCSKCDYRSVQRSNFKMHLKTHTGEKAFACYTCDYKCIRKATLKRHLKSHTGEKSLSCKICDYKCAYRSSLKVHLRTHTGEKP